jgi:hypothetical protein
MRRAVEKRRRREGQWCRDMQNKKIKREGRGE